MSTEQDIQDVTEQDIQDVTEWLRIELSKKIVEKFVELADIEFETIMNGSGSEYTLIGVGS